MSYNLKSVDWTKYLDRKQPLVLFAAFIRPYGNLLEEAVGFRFQHQLHIYSGDSGTFVKSSRELSAALDYFLELAKGDARLVQWRDEGVRYNQKADVLLEEFRTSPPSIDAASFWPLWETCERVMLYDTVIPFRIMASINKALEANNGVMPEEFRPALELFEPFRAGAKYPLLVEEVFPHIYAAAARVSGITDVALLSNATPLEFKELFEQSTTLDEETLKRRNEWCAFWEEPDTGIVQFSYDKEEMRTLGVLQEYAEVSEVKGSVAYPGKAEGVVRIVNGTGDMGKVEEGDIIVSFNTNPSLMGALVKCSAMVTDEGGIMCHAAIVSRELKKPCVIGTKVATKVFKDGDRVEVDAERGIVRVLQRA